MNTISLWEDITRRSTSYPMLEHDIEVDVAIVGAGITGITAAMQLIAAGKKVAILESGRVGSGTTGFSTGNLYVAIQPYFHTIENKFGLDTVKAVAQSRKLAIDLIEKVIQDRGIQCSFHRRPWYLYSINNENDTLVDKEIKTLHKADMQIDRVDAVPAPFKITRAARMDNQARFNPLQYVVALADDLRRQGCQIFENTTVENIEEKDVCTLSTPQAKVRAQQVFVATHVPKGIHHTQFLTAPYRSYVVAARLQNTAYPNANLWDTSKPHHATSTHSSTSEELDLLMVADSHHKTGQADDHREQYDKIETYLRQHYSVDSIVYRWSAQHYQAADGLPYIGRTSWCSKHVYIATGYFADGLVYGTTAGVLVAEQILDQRSHWEKLYNPQRLKPFASATSFLKESINVFFEYLKDYPGHVDARDLSDIAKGEGKIISIDGEKCGAYRDDQNQLHIVSAVCTHMRGIVKWNNAEKSWDCPCHGSRFTVDGKVIEGPAILDLERKQ
jgi:glycine/D-amino acid oxidase-like deaminating enzyme/nitrite reductase/ring-hydroxylating ferredoxin subunit